MAMFDVSVLEGSVEALRPFRPRPFQRLVDLIVGGSMLVSVFPIMLAIALCIWLRDGAPVVFGHRRIGRDGRSFTCYKFRTMVREAEDTLQGTLAADPKARREWEEHSKLRDDPRVLGGLGRYLRRTSLDELPQIVNVLRGEMSLVGPRPITETELSHYGRDVGWYLAARPGLTGAWQTSGRSDTNYDRRVVLDVDYVKSANVMRDIEIMLRTPAVLMRGKGAY